MLRSDKEQQQQRNDEREAISWPKIKLAVGVRVGLLHPDSQQEQVHYDYCISFSTSHYTHTRVASYYYTLPARLGTAD